MLHRPRKEGLGPAYLAGFRRALDAGRGARRRDRLRLLARPGGRAAPARRGRQTRTSCSARATCRAAGSRTGAPCAALISSGGSLYARAAARRPRPRPHRRLQVLPPRRARDDRPRRDPLARLRLPDRDDLPRAAPGLPRARGADPLRRPRGRRLEDVAVDRARGDLEGAAPAPRGAAEAGCERGHRRDVRGGGRSRAAGATIVDFWAPWCKPCKAIEPILEALAAEHGLGLVRLNIDEHLGVPSRYGVLSLPTVILFEGGEPQGDRRRRAPAQPLRAGVRGVARLPAS